MENLTVTLPLDAERLRALEIYLGQENTTVQKCMEAALRQIYEEKVPEQVRSYLEARTAPQHSKRPSRPRPKPPAAVKTNEEEQTCAAEK